MTKDMNSTAPATSHRSSRAPRLFLDADLAAGAVVELDKAQANYLGNVLRLKAGQPVLVFNGRDGEWRADVEASGRKALALAIRDQTRVQTELGRIHYLFAPLKQARLDYVVQKAVEMGAASLTPVITQHTQVTRLNQDRLVANVIEAAEQCGILAVPAVRREVRLAEAVAGLSPACRLIFCDEEAPEPNPIAALAGLDAACEVAVLIGPEGGFDATERRLLTAYPGVVRLALGPRILRADTAAVAALALVQSVIGDWRDQAPRAG
ncbi:Ribosomal RNA small subunit methyltransferase E [Chelatococcus asaccharovorans]|nr:Ribosomal RNA small subunit methyltransferase E [Chelatococcus asaccharovorans]CAH1679294.1 Ribosomal RNA small subunit methyltransferase E [Chelatococcus asaccharovorans]